MRSILEMPVSAAILSPFQRLNELYYGAVASAHIGVSEHVGNLTGQLEHAPTIVKAAAQLGSATVGSAVATIVSRSSQGALQVDAVADVISSVTSHIPDVPFIATAKQPGAKSGSETQQHTQLSTLATSIEDTSKDREPAPVTETIENNLKAADDRGLQLPADVNAAPEATLAKGETVWKETVDYAAELGYELGSSSKDEAIKWDLTDDTLDNMGITWAEATDLPIGQRVALLPQDEMVERLEALGADQTHEADRPADINADPKPDPSPNPNPNPQNTDPTTKDLPDAVPTEEGDTVYACDAPDPWRGWLTKWDFGCEYNDEEEIYATATLGALLLAAGVGLAVANDRRSRRIDDTDEIVAVPVAAPAPAPQWTPPAGSPLGAAPVAAPVFVDPRERAAREGDVDELTEENEELREENRKARRGARWAKLRGAVTGFLAAKATAIATRKPKRFGGRGIFNRR